MQDCIFCKIARKEIPSTTVFEDDLSMAFHDIHPKAKHHLLIIPKKHIESLINAQESEQTLIGHLVWNAKKIAVSMGLQGYQVRLHVGEKGGQEIPHLHFHLLADA